MWVLELSRPQLQILALPHSRFVTQVKSLTLPRSGTGWKVLDGKANAVPPVWTLYTLKGALLISPGRRGGAAKSKQKLGSWVGEEGRGRGQVLWRRERPTGCGEWGWKSRGESFPRARLRPHSGSPCEAGVGGPAVPKGTKCCSPQTAWPFVVCRPQCKTWPWLSSQAGRAEQRQVDWGAEKDSYYGDTGASENFTDKEIAVVAQRWPQDSLLDSRKRRVQLLFVVFLKTINPSPY